MQPYIRPSDYSQLFRPASPVIAFILPWLVVLIGQQLALCNIIIPTYSTFYLVIFGNILTSLFIAFGIQTFFPQRLAAGTSILSDLSISKGFKLTTYWLIFFYLTVQIFQVIYFKGVPLYWLFSGNSLTAYDYGIPSLNGLLNAIYLLTTTSLYLIFLQEKKTRLLVCLLFMLMLPILLVNRQLLMSVFLQVSCCMLLYRPKALKKMVLAFFVLLAAFVVVGNMRTGVQSLTQILGPKDYIPESLYSLLWIYAYVVTPFNNLNAAMDAITPLGTPFFEISSLLPTVFRVPSIIGEGGVTGFALVNDNMNVSSFYLPLVLDFGQWYAFLFMAAFQVVLFLSYRRALRAHSWIDVVQYSVLYMVMVLSIFTNLLLFLPTIAQLIIIKVLKWKIYRSQGVVVLGNTRFET